MQTNPARTKPALFAVLEERRWFVVRFSSQEVKQMPTTMRVVLAAAALAAVVGTAIAADMTGDEIKATISGKTV